MTTNTYIYRIYTNGKDMNMQSILEIIMLLGIFIGVLLLTYVVTKKLSMMNQNMAFNKNMKVKEVLQISPGQYLYIVEIGEEYHLIGSTNKGNITYCTKLQEEALTFNLNEQKSFAEELNKLVKGKWGNKDENK